MRSVQKQCQVQLELEQTKISARLQRSTFVGEADGLDPANWEILQKDRVKLQSIERALKRLANGQFGLCQECHQPIGAKRLLALPSAELCIECQQQLERTIIGRRGLKQLSSAALR
ncbi:MAG: TraR/DksA family transcriptional regulator [Chloroflexi bacterium]|nr:TraR/DksA family transcriptional regulator [Chloroflexota bacterium]